MGRGSITQDKLSSDPSFYKIMEGPPQDRPDAQDLSLSGRVNTAQSIYIRDKAVEDGGHT